MLVAEPFAVESVGLALLRRARAVRTMFDAVRSFDGRGSAPWGLAVLAGTAAVLVTLARLVLSVGFALWFDAGSMSAVLSAFVVGDCFGGATFLVANLEAAAAVLAAQTLRGGWERRGDG